MSFFKKIRHCAGISLLLMLACWIWLQVDFTFANEAWQVKSSFLIKRLFRTPDSSYINEFVFVDVSGNKQMAPKADGSGDELITDRARLDSFFQLIHRYPDYRYILCDVAFEKAAAGDSSLEKSLMAMRRVIIPAIETENGIQPAIYSEVEQGLTSYAVSSGFNASSELVKYRLLENENARSIPLMMNERIDGQRSASAAGLLWRGGRIGFNRFIPSFRIWPEQLRTDSGNKVVSLNDMLMRMRFSDSAAFAADIKGKYIVMGDFESSGLPIALGQMPGPLFLANVFLSVREGDNNISVLWLLYAWAAFTLLSYLLFYPPGPIERWEKKQVDVPRGLLVLIPDFCFAVLLLWLLSTFSYLWFKQHLDIVAPSFLLSVFDVVKKIIDNKRKSIQ